MDIIKATGFAPQAVPTARTASGLPISRAMGLLDPRLLEGYRWRIGGNTPRLPERPPQA